MSRRNMKDILHKGLFLAVNEPVYQIIQYGLVAGYPFDLLILQKRLQF